MGAHGEGQVCATKGEQPRAQVRSVGEGERSEGGQGVSEWEECVKHPASSMHQRPSTTFSLHPSTHTLTTPNTNAPLLHSQDALPDEWLLPHSPGAPQQHHTHNHRGNGSSTGRHTVTTHKQVQSVCGRTAVVAHAREGVVLLACCWTQNSGNL